MRRVYTIVLAAVFLLSLSSFTAATQISAENVTVELDDDGVAQVDATVHIVSLTTERFSYFMPYSVTGFTAEADGENIACEEDANSAGARFLCTLPRDKDVTVHMRYKTGELVEREGNDYTFEYTHNILSPTQVYHVDLVLPEGFGLAGSEAAVQPAPVEVTSTGSGRHILVTWEEQVDLGEQATFSTMYEQLQPAQRVFGQFRLIIIGIVALLLLGVTLLIVLHRRNTEGEEVVMQVLQDDEQEILRFVRDRGGECRQNEIVDHVEYSKAKVSAVLSDLESRGIVEKVKDGRTNVVRLQRELTEKS